MRQNHFTMLPERAFQPRGPIGMSLHGPAEEVFDFVGDVVQGAVDVVSDVGSYIDDNVIQPILEDPVEAIVVAAATYLGGAPGAFIAKTGMELEDGKQLNEALESGAKTAAGVYIGGEVSSAFGGSGATGTEGFGQLSDEVYQGASGTVPSAATSAAAPIVPSAFETAISGTSTSAPPIGTAGFGTALPSASEVSAGLEASGFAPGTAANLAGQTSAGIGATNLLGGATAAAPLAASNTISIQDALRGARLINSLLTPQQPQVPNMLGRAQEALAQQGGAVDYNTLLGLLNQRASAAGLLGTQFQPQSINIASLLG